MCKGKLPIHIFQDAGLDIEVIGNNRIGCASKRWRNIIMNQERLD
mgnify:CR=1 FL=1